MKIDRKTLTEIAGDLAVSITPSMHGDHLIVRTRDNRDMTRLVNRLREGGWQDGRDFDKWDRTVAIDQEPDTR